MTKISIYILLILIYLGLAKSFYPQEESIEVINDARDLAALIHESPATAVLIDQFTTGFIIPTYFQKYMVVSLYRPSYILTVRTNHRWWESQKDYLGMSIFTRVNNFTPELFLPTPPGAAFLDDPTMGEWYDENHEDRWRFHRPYRELLPELLGWDNFVPNRTFYNLAQLHQEQHKVFYGLNNEFGTKGTIGQRLLIHSILRPNNKKMTWKDYVKSWFYWPTPHEPELAAPKDEQILAPDLMPWSPRKAYDGVTR